MEQEQALDGQAEAVVVPHDAVPCVPLPLTLVPARTGLAGSPLGSRCGGARLHMQVPAVQRGLSGLVTP